MGEANVRQELGKLQQNPAEKLAYLQQAQEIYAQIHDIYSQSRNLLFIAEVQLNLGNKDSAIASLTHAQQLAITINYLPLQEYSQAQIALISATDSTPSNGLIARLRKFTQQRWVQFLMFFLLGLVVFLLLHR